MASLTGTHQPIRRPHHLAAITIATTALFSLVGCTTSTANGSTGIEASPSASASETPGAMTSAPSEETASAKEISDGTHITVDSLHKQGKTVHEWSKNLSTASELNEYSALQEAVTKQMEDRDWDRLTLTERSTRYYNYLEVAMDSVDTDIADGSIQDGDVLLDKIDWSPDVSYMNDFWSMGLTVQRKVLEKNEIQRRVAEAVYRHSMNLDNGEYSPLIHKHLSSTFFLVNEKAFPIWSSDKGVDTTTLQLKVSAIEKNQLSIGGDVVSIVDHKTEEPSGYILGISNLLEQKYWEDTVPPAGSIAGFAFYPTKTVEGKEVLSFNG